MTFSYATSTSGPSAGGIGWVNFENLTINPGQTINGITGILNDGTIVTFDLSLSVVSGIGRPFVATQPPTFPGAQFGIAGYTGIVGNVALNGAAEPLPGTSLFTINNIIITNPDLSPVPNYTVIIADAERSNLNESWTWNTNGGNWNLLATLGPNPPVLNGIGTQTATIFANGAAGPSAAYVLTTQTPTELLLTSVSDENSRQAFAIGFATTRVRLQKNIAGRANTADQFELNIGGIPSANATTIGATSGIQPQIANVFATPSLVYTINETMALGSVSNLSDYTQVVSAVNSTPAGSIPSTGSLPISFTPALGDDVTYTILNIAPEKFIKTVDKEYADIGDILTYTISVENPNNFVINNILVTDQTPLGTTLVPGSLIVAGSAYTGTDLNSGITLTSIPANTTATITWQVEVNTLPPVSNPVVNIAIVDVPGGTSGPTNSVSTQINTAYVTVNKVTDLAFADAGDIITYTLLLTNAGNVAANNVIITDVVPNGTTFVPGSIVGATGIPPTLNVASIPVGGNSTVEFKVKVDSIVPNPNPIPNTATVDYTYTVDPLQPDGANGTRESNIVTTQANMALIKATKTVDAAYAETDQILTYTLSIENSGNVAANDIIITDAIPAGTTFVEGSVVGALGEPPTMTIANITAGGTATVSFQVKVGDAIPTINPITNIANIDFSYTVNPNEPNAASGNAISNEVTTQVNDANITTVLTVDKAVSDIGEVLTYTITLTNTGNVDANNVVINAPNPAGTTYINGSLLGATGAPPTLTLSNSIPAGGSTTVTYQVLVGDSIPAPNPITQSVETNFDFTQDPANPNGESGTSSSNTVETRVNSAIISTDKSVDKAYANIGDTITYTITISNTGNVTANNVVINDILPIGVTFIPATLIGATGAPPTLTVNSPIPANSSVVVRYQVKIGMFVPIINPIENSASAAFSYTVDSTNPNGVSGVSYSLAVNTQVNTAKLEMKKSVDKNVAYLNDIITYQISVSNLGNAPADDVIITDPIPNGTTLVPGSIIVNVPYTILPNGSIQLNNSLQADEIVTISFKVLVVDVPNPNPILNTASSNYNYIVDPESSISVNATAQSNIASTTVFRNNFRQQVSDLIESVALEQAALGAIANAEGAKIQKIAAMPGVTPQQLQCLNKSVADMTDSINMLEAILKQKLQIITCQINGEMC